MFGRKQNRSHLINQARQETVVMLDRAHQVFGIAWQILTENGESEHLAKLDQEINDGEQIVRRLVIEHLTMNPEQELPASLTLVSIVHDVERLGDYAKSIAELRDMSDATLANVGLGKRCREVQAEIEPMFTLAIQGITDDDEAKAATLMARHREIKAQTDKITSDAVANEHSDRSDLLAVLVSRYLRRVSAHLSNIVSSIINPFDLISRDN